MSAAHESSVHAAADESPPTPARQDTAVDAEFVALDALAGEELRTLPPELLRILSATGC